MINTFDVLYFQIFHIIWSSISDAYLELLNYASLNDLWILTSSTDQIQWMYTIKTTQK